MKFYRALYVGEQLNKTKDHVIEKLEKKEWQLDVYLIVLAKSEQNQLEIFHSVLLMQDKIEEEDLFVVGIAKGFHEALTMVEKITQEVYEKTGDTKIRTYILEKENE